MQHEMQTYIVYDTFLSSADFKFKVFYSATCKWRSVHYLVNNVSESRFSQFLKSYRKEPWLSLPILRVFQEPVSVRTQDFPLNIHCMIYIYSLNLSDTWHSPVSNTWMRQTCTSFVQFTKKRRRGEGA